MSKNKSKKPTSFINNVKTQINLMTKKKKILYFSFLAMTFICLGLCLWGTITISMSQNTIYTYLMDLHNAGTLETTYPQLAVNGAWFYKGVEQFSWYLVSTQELGSVAYYFAVIFAIIATPLFIYYISSFMIVFFPKKDKALKVNKKALKTKDKTLKTKDKTKKKGQ